MANASTDSAGQVLRDVWQEHLHSEFVMKDAKAALATMSDDPYVLAVPIAAGGRGRDGVYNFYHNIFLVQIPVDFTPEPISHVAGEGRRWL